MDTASALGGASAAQPPCWKLPELRGAFFAGDWLGDLQASQQLRGW